MKNTEIDAAALVSEIRSHYETPAATRLDELKALDKRVKAPATRFAWSFGTLAALVMGSGMSLIMTDIGTALGLGDAWLPGLVVGILGLVLALVTYPIYRKILAARRRKYAGQILALADDLAD